MATIDINDAYILNETGAQVDKVTGLFYKDESTTAAEKAFAQLNVGASGGGGGGGRNLLDNPWFQVNQRSITSGSNPSATAVYTRDRWKIARCSSYVFNDNGTVTTSWDGTGSGCYLIQYAFPDTAAMLRGKTVTLSVYVGGTLYTKTLTLPNQTNNSFVIGDGLTVNIVDVIASGRGYECQFYHSVSAGKTLGPFKLELGSTSTLANDVPPDYGEELAKCMRYFIRLNAPALGCNFGIGRATNATTCSVFVPLPVPLRASPTVSVNGIGELQLIGNGGGGNASACSYAGRSESGVNLSFTASGLTASHLYTLVRNGSTSCYIDLSADL